jgi:hypothetical protein
MNCSPALISFISICVVFKVVFAFVWSLLSLCRQDCRKAPPQFSTFFRSDIYSKFFGSKLDTQFSGSICSISILGSYQGILQFRIFSADKGMPRAYIGNNHHGIVERNHMGKFRAAREHFDISQLATSKKIKAKSLLNQGVLMPIPPIFD